MWMGERERERGRKRGLGLWVSGASATRKGARARTHARAQEPIYASMHAVCMHARRRTHARTRRARTHAHTHHPRAHTHAHAHAHVRAHTNELQHANGPCGARATQTRRTMKRYGHEKQLKVFNARQLFRCARNAAGARARRQRRAPCLRRAGRARTRARKRPPPPPPSPTTAQHAALSEPPIFRVERLGRRLGASGVFVK